MRNALFLLLLLLAGVARAAGPVDADYWDYAAFRTGCDQLAESELVAAEVIGVTRERRDVVALTVGGGDAPDRRPAILVLGSVSADSLVGDELARRMVAELVARCDEGDADATRLLDDVALYVIPRPSPDASERPFQPPGRHSAANARPADDDRDGRVDEDPPADLNGDGLVTMMRIEDPAGGWIPHPDDARVMIRADPAKGEAGRYRVLTEDDADDDGDGEFAEDPPGGVDFDRNFTFEYPYFERGAGPNQVSEPETRAIADFAFDHPNIFLVFSFAPQANLLKDWESSGGGDRIATKVLSDDAPYFKLMAETFRERFEPKGFPEPAPMEGSFAAWAYFHYGRWSLATPGWWPPAAAEEDRDDTIKDATDEPAGEPEEKEDTQEKPYSRGKDKVRALAWLDRIDADGFVPWTEWSGPRPEGVRGRIEIGGFKPFALHPPVTELDALASEYLDFLLELASKRPLVGLSDAEITTTSGVVRQTSRVINRGVLPTASKMGERSGIPSRLEAALALPEGAGLLAGPRRQPIGRLDGGGGNKEVTWLWRAGDQQAGPAEVRLGFGYQRDAEGRLPVGEAIGRDADREEAAP